MVSILKLQQCTVPGTTGTTVRRMICTWPLSSHVCPVYYSISDVDFIRIRMFYCRLCTCRLCILVPKLVQCYVQSRICRVQLKVHSSIICLGQELSWVLLLLLSFCYVYYYFCYSGEGDLQSSGEGGLASKRKHRSSGSSPNNTVNLRGVHDRSRCHNDGAKSDVSSDQGSLRFDQFLDAQGSDQEEESVPQLQQDRTASRMSRVSYSATFYPALSQ
jgi:hypothetical protein